jgi:hypothetical protein
LTFIDAAKLARLVCDQYGKDSARLVILGRGDEYAVYICRPGYFCWCFKDYTTFRHREKQAEQAKRKRGRPPRRGEEVQHAISYQEVFAVAM